MPLPQVSNQNVPKPSSYADISPAKFYALVDLCRTFWSDKNAELHKALLIAEPTIKELVEALAAKHEILRRATLELAQDAQHTVKKDKAGRNEVLSEDDDSNPHGVNFIRTMAEIVSQLMHAVGVLQGITSNLRPATIILPEGGKTVLKDFQDMQQFIFEMQLNSPTIDRFVNTIREIDNAQESITGVLERVTQTMEMYYRYLHGRHTVGGIEIHRDPVITDIALSIYSNIDSSGEIADGKQPNEISLFTMNKAKTMLEMVTSEEIWELVNSPSKFNAWVIEIIKKIYALTSAFKNDLKGSISQTKALLDSKFDSVIEDLISSAYRNDISKHAAKFEALNPLNIRFKDPTHVLSKEERWVAKYRSDTVKKLVELLAYSKPDINQVINYVLSRKAELKKFFHEENSFYVCRISAGNPFLGEAPGALQVIPGQRPNANLDMILGSGFDEVKQFFTSIEASAQWHDLFVASSPSMTADKSNILLVGPQGCGKTEIMRAVGGDKKSIGVFAQGSDFNTCWKGEAEKNPKRLFEGGLKIQKESKKHVHFLIDEIDSVLNNDKELGGFNLTLEFQILMDGVVQYPNLSVWGATNNPQRIPMPMIRRFSKVLIVGELAQDDRIKLLKHFVAGFMPIRDFNEDHWNAMAKRLDGATGDVLRKVADHLWREKMTAFTQKNPEMAYDLMHWLQKDGPFQVTDFDSKKRTDFKDRLKHHASISPAELDKTITSHLKNMAIHNEIKTAVATYKAAKEFLASFNDSKIITP